MGHSHKLLMTSTALLCLYSVSGQGNTTINQYLNQAQQTIAFMPLEAIPRDNSWIDQADLRYSGNDQEEHSLALRFLPKFKSQRLAENRIYDLLNLQNAVEADEQLNDELKQRYMVLIDLFEISSEIELQQNKVALSAKALQLNRSLVPTESFRLEDLQSAEIDHQSNQQQLILMKNRFQRILQTVDGIDAQALRNFLQEWSQQVGDWNQFSQLSAELLASYESNQFGPSSDQINFRMAQQELQLARSESQSWLKFVELKLSHRPSGDDETTLGLAFPLGGNDLGISQRAVEVNRANISLQLQLLQLSKVIQQKISDLQWFQDQQLALSSSKEILEQHYSRLRAANQPGILLKLQAEILNYQNAIGRNRIRGLRSYIELLHAAGYLAKKPLINWLLHDLPRL